MRPPAAPARHLAAAAGCIVLYILLDLWLRSVALPGSTIIPWYPSAGLAFAALVLVGPVAAVPLFAARLLLVLLAGRSAGPFPASVVEAALQVLAYTAGAMWLRRHVTTTGRTWTLTDAVHLSASLLGAAAAAGLISAYSLSLWRGQPWSRFWENALSFTAGDASGALVIVPIVLFVIASSASPHEIADADESRRLTATGSPDEQAPRAGLQPRRTRERTLKAIALVAAVGLAIASRLRGDVALGALSFVPLVWVGLRDGVRGAAVVIAVYGIAGGLSALFLGIAPDRLLDYQALLVIFGLTGLFVGAVRTSAVESQARYWHLLATASEGIWRLDAEGRTLYVNERMSAMLGRTPNEILGRSALEYIAPEDRERWLESRRERNAGKEGMYELSVLHADGTRRRVLVAASPVRSATDHSSLGAVAMVTDITAWREAERGQARAQSLLEAAFRSSHDAMILFRAGDEMIVDVNDVWCQVTGYRREDVIGRSQRLLDIWADPRDSERLAKVMAEQGAVRDFEFSFHRKLPDGTTDLGTAVLSANPARVADTLYFLVTGRDITEQRRAEQHRSQLQRLEELGRLAGGIAHDFNNLLTVVHSYAQIIHQSVDAGLTVEAGDAEEIERAADRGRTLIKRLLAFSRNQPVEVRPVDLNEVLRSADGLLRPLLGSRAIVRKELADELPPIRADLGQLDQLLLNFAVNARDAMPEGGEFTLATRVVNVPASAAAAMLGPELPGGEYVVLDVTDTGVGMDTATQARIFEPFFTTKEPGRGTGLGLAVVFGIVRQANGAVRVRSQPGGGTTFTVFWPSSRESADAADASGTVELAAPLAHVLVVEDEDAVREVARRALERAGFRVSEATNGRDAIAHLHEMRKRGEAPDLIVSDVVMPLMNGRELAEHLAVHEPGLRVVLMSGYAEERLRGMGLPNVFSTLIEKPFELSTLVDTVRSALATPPGVIAQSSDAPAGAGSTPDGDAPRS